MKIGIIGSGNIGGTAAKLFVNVGHQVAISNSRGPESLASFVNSVGPNIKAKTVEDAIKFGDVILLAIPWRRRQDLLSVSELFDSKIVIDAMNPYSETFGVIDLGNSTSSEEVLKQIPNSSHLVKAFNTIYYEHLSTKGNPSAPKEDRFAIFVAGDDLEAKATVSKLIEYIGFVPIYTGSLREGGRKQQPGSPIYNNPMTAKVAHARLREIA
jgi:8-hydroxy-5-deazaflavin:NADPH oxidoreductase